MRRSALFLVVGLVALACGDSPTDSGPLPVAGYDPVWESALNHNEVIAIDPDPGLTPEENGERLLAAAAGLEPGTTLYVGDGEWVLPRPLRLEGRGTASLPIALQGRRGTHPAIRGADGGVDPLIEIGRGSAVSHVLVRGLDVSGSGILLMAFAGEELWIDDVVFHDGGSGVQLGAWQGMSGVHVTRCVFRDASMGTPHLQLGSGTRPVSASVVAANRFEGEWAGILWPAGAGNHVAANTILGSRHLALGASLLPAEGDPNVIEGNVMVGGTEQTMLQVSRGAEVRNNLVINHSPWASYAYEVTLASDLVIVHNTFVADFSAVRLASPPSDLVFANNACYAREDRGLRISPAGDLPGLRGNVVFGTEFESTSGYRLGNGLRDFVDLTWDGAARDGHPSAGSALIGAGVPGYHVERDVEGLPRGSTVVAGAYRLP